MTIVFDGPALRIRITAPGTYEADRDFYSAWKTWVLLSDNAKFPRAFDTTGGDPISATENISGYFFLRNDLGWRITSPEADGQVVINGNLLPREDAEGVFLPPVGDFSSFIRQVVSADAIQVQTGISGLTPAEGAYLQEIHGMHGLTTGQPLVVTDTSRGYGPVAQTITDDGVTTTVTRVP